MIFPPADPSCNNKSYHKNLIYCRGSSRGMGSLFCVEYTNVSLLMYFMLRDPPSKNPASAPVMIVICKLYKVQTQFDGASERRHTRHTQVGSTSILGNLKDYSQMYNNLHIQLNPSENNSLTRSGLGQGGASL